MGATPDVKLVPRLVPQPLLGISAARILAGAKWKRIRADAMDASGGACVVCGATRDKGMIGDEEWEYSDGIATLTGVRIVCPDCNAVTHIGSTGACGYGDMARDHMCRVNGMTTSEANRIIDASFREWRARSLVDWTICGGARPNGPLSRSGNPRSSAIEGAGNRRGSVSRSVFVGPTGRSALADQSDPASLPTTGRASPPTLRPVSIWVACRWRVLTVRGWRPSHEAYPTPPGRCNRCNPGSGGAFQSQRWRVQHVRPHALAHERAPLSGTCCKPNISAQPGVRPTQRVVSNPGRHPAL
jgi:hypothetical protein